MTRARLGSGRAESHGACVESVGMGQFGQRILMLGPPADPADPRGPLLDISPAQTTQLFLRWRRGEPGAIEALLPAVYEEMRRLAAANMRFERAGHTLQPTALVHEAYLRLVSSPGLTVN